MLNLSISLPAHRLHLRLVKRRGANVSEPILPSLEELRSLRSGNKASRFFRHIFEHKNIRKILGSNLALVLIASSIIPGSASASTIAALAEPQEEVITVVDVQTQLETKPGIHYPVETVKINQRYAFFHPGVDFGAQKGATVTPIMAGTVTEAGWDFSGYGNKVVVRHNENMESVYAHLSKITVKVGDQVQTSAKIGEVGSTGRSTGAHLHLEVRENGVNVNPLSVLPKLR